MKCCTELPGRCIYLTYHPVAAYPELRDTTEAVDPQLTGQRSGSLEEKFLETPKHTELHHKDYITLRDILESWNPSWSKKVTIRLAIIAIFSTLAFGRTSWLPRGISKEWILFLQDSNRMSLEPFIVPNWLGLYDPPAVPDHCLKSESDYGHIQLAVILLELWTQSTLESSVTKRDKLGGCIWNPDTTVRIANRVLSSLDWSGHEHYRAAVSSCLRLWEGGQQPHTFQYQAYLLEEVFRHLLQEAIDIGSISDSDDKFTMADMWLSSIPRKLKETEVLDSFECWQDK